MTEGCKDSTFACSSSSDAVDMLTEVHCFVLQESQRVESELQDAVSTVQNATSASVTALGAAGRKRSAEVSAVPDAYSQLHFDKRVELEA